MKTRAKKLAVLLLAGTLVLSGLVQPTVVNAEEIGEVQTEVKTDEETEEETDDTEQNKDEEEMKGDAGEGNDGANSEEDSESALDVEAGVNAAPFTTQEEANAEDVTTTATADTVNVPMAAAEDAEAEDGTIDYATFIQNVVAANYNYDGGGVTVKIKPSSACLNGAVHFNELCTAENRLPAPDGNQPQRVQKSIVQYQPFNGIENVAVKNVDFIFESADFSLCMNNKGWIGSTTVNKASGIKVAEIQLLNSGDVTFDGCSFDGVVVGPWNGRGTLTVTNSTFKNAYDVYALKDVHAKNAVITGNTFENCAGGIYFAGNVPKGEYTITGNTFNNMDQNAEFLKKNTRGMIQFSAEGDYSNAKVTIADNTSTGEAAAIRQLNPTLNQNVLNPETVKAENSFAGEVFTNNTYGNGPVYYNGNTYKTLAEALKAVYMSDPDKTLEDTAVVYCKKGANVGDMTHAHVADNINIYGNGAKLGKGERDLEVDTYKYSRETGNQSADGTFLDKDITINVKDLNGIAVWGQRNTDYVVNVNIENAQNIGKVYISGTAGENNISIKNSSFDSADMTHSNTAIYSNASGNITVDNTTFTNVTVPINLNHKDTGVQNVTVTNCTFIDCGQGSDGNQTYAAPIRVVAQEGAETNLTVKNTTFADNDGVLPSNCDILIGDGRFDATDKPGDITFSMEDTKANVLVQEKGYYAEDGTVADNTKAKRVDVEKNEVVTIDKDGKLDIVEKHINVTHVDKKDATCTEDGNNEYWYCEDCGKYFSDEALQNVITKEETVIKAGHKYDDRGKCTVCGVLTPDAEAANKVDALIDAIGSPDKVTLDSRDAIEAAVKAYNALTADQKKLVTGYVDLDKAIDVYNELLEAEAGKDPEEETDKDPEKDPGKDPDKDKPIDKPDNGTDGEDKKPGAVQTGDTTNVAGYMTVMALAAGVAVFAVIRRKRRG